MDTLKRAMLAALKTNYGRISLAAEAVGISRQTHYNWLNADEEYKEAVKEIDEMSVDFVESKLHALIDGATYEAMTMDGTPVQLRDKPNVQAVKYYLSTKGKSRGWVERQEIDANIQPVLINVGINQPTENNGNSDSEQ